MESKNNDNKLSVKVADAMCGIGKTSAAINMMRKASTNREKKFLYITPYLEEVDRIIKECPEQNFVQPREYGSKLMDIKRLIAQGKNIASTHALFTMFDKETIDYALFNNYTLVMDEVAEVVKEYNISDYDLKVILEKYAKRGPNGKLIWTVPEYVGKYEEHKRLIELGAIYMCGDTAVIWTFPVSCFNAFDEIYILTYMFDAQLQKYYYDLYGISYEQIYVKGNSLDTYEFTEEPVEYDYEKYKGKIHIIEKEKMNLIGEEETALSKNWYNKNQDTPYMLMLKKNAYNFFQNICQTPASKNLWTTFKEFSELIQWLFRSAIRNEEEVYLYVPSSRMRRLIKDWANQYEMLSNE